MTQKQYGRLSFVEELVGTYYGASCALSRNWRLACECGNVVVAPRNNVVRGLVKSCGCYRKEWAANKKRTHGASSSPEYGIWCAMKRRCYNKNCKDFKDYGALGVSVCDRWLDSFDAFISDMGPRPTSKHSIDRLDPLGNYEPENCRWATCVQQQSNKRTTVLLKFKGQALTLSAISAKSGVPKETLRRYVYKLNLSADQAVSKYMSRLNSL